MSKNDNRLRFGRANVALPVAVLALASLAGTFPPGTYASPLVGEGASTAQAASAQVPKTKDRAKSKKGKRTSAKPTETLGTIQVAGRTFDESIPVQLGQYGNPLSIIPSKEISANNIVDAATALELLAPRLAVIPLNGPFSYVTASMDGSQTGDILWLVDGVRIDNRLYASTTPLDTIPAAMIDHIEVLGGGQSLFFGTSAVAGAVNIVTKDFLSEGSDGNLSIGIDSHAGRHLSGFARTASGSNEFVVYGSADSSNGYRDIDPSEYVSPFPTQTNRGYDVKSLGFKYRRVMTDSSLTISYMHNDAHLDLAAPQLISSYYNQRKEGITSLKYNWKPSDEFAVFVRGYYHRWDSHVTEIDQVIGEPGQLAIVQPHLFWGYRDKGLNLEARIRPGGYFDYYLGYDYQNYYGSDQSLEIGRHAEAVNAVIADIRTSPEKFSKLHLSFGARYNKPITSGGTTIWNVSGRYDISHNLFVRGAFGTAYELPDAEELFQIDPCCARGNPDLAPQMSRNFNIGVGGDTALGDGVYLGWSLGGFTRRVRNLISTAALPSGLATFVNLPGESKIKGYQATLTSSFGNGFSFSGSFVSAVSSTAAAGAAAAETNVVSGIPRTVVKLAFNWKPSSLPFGGSLLVNHVGTIYAAPIDTLVPYANYWIANLSGYWSFGPNRRQQITARVANLTNRRYTSFADAFFPYEPNLPAVPFGLLGESRTYYVTYRYNF